MNNKISVLFFIIIFFSQVNVKVFSENTSSPTNTNYDDINFPQWSKDLRRTEIITFGSLPFVTLWTMVGYSLYEYGEFKNPLDKSTDSFTEEDQWKIIKISAATSAALGLTDLIINIIVRSKKKNILNKQKEASLKTFTIVPENERKNNLPPPKIEYETDEQAEEKLKAEIKQNQNEILIEGVESYIF